MTLATGIQHDLFSKLRQFARVGVGRILGTVHWTNGAYKELVSLGERTYFMRAELNALVKLLIDKGVFSIEEWNDAVTDEALHLIGEVGKLWPEIEVYVDHYEVKDVAAFAKRSKDEGWPP